MKRVRDCDSLRASTLKAVIGTLDKDDLYKLVEYIAVNLSPEEIGQMSSNLTNFHWSKIRKCAQNAVHIAEQWLARHNPLVDKWSLRYVTDGTIEVLHVKTEQPVALMCCTLEGRVHVKYRGVWHSSSLKMLPPEFVFFAYLTRRFTVERVMEECRRKESIKKEVVF
jgi:hypothetical protein